VPPTRTPEVSICIVSTDAREHLLACVDSVFANPPSVPFEVLALDNGSTDGTSKAVHDCFGDRVEVVRLERRRGKAENDSDLMTRARGRWCLLLNEDSRLEPGAADRLAEALESDPGAAAAGARLLDPTGTPQPSAWRFPGVRSAAAAAVFLHRRLVVQSHGEATREVDWAQSAGLLVRRTAFEEVGPMDPAFFVYSDEVDWQKRAWDAGWHVLFVPAARVVHHEQLSTGDSARRRIVEFSRNRDLYMRKHHGRLAALLVRILTAWTYAVRALVSVVLPGRDARRYALHAYHSLFPRRGEGLREAA
jgi:N-acetylglucosaminyl-diphospho-decaprenol L-rhamnosyltransferase